MVEKSLFSCFFYDEICEDVPGIDIAHVTMALKDSQFRAWYRIGNTLRFFLEMSGSVSIIRNF